jgi:predicted AlkP superfamily phosphohydrolase/phosphomutase
VGDTAVFLNRWLAEGGWLRFEEGSSLSHLAGLARSAALKAIPSSWQAPLFRLAGGRLANALESKARFAGVDWRHTAAVSEELNYFPSIWLNLQGREPLGTVAPERYRELCEELRRALLAWRDPISQQPVVRDVWRRDELYHGKFVENAPDLVLNLNRPGGYSYVCLPSRGQSGSPLVRLEGSELSGGKLSGMSGSHRPDGLCVVWGEGVARGKIEGAWIADMTPTILSLCNLPAPDDWDGKVLPCVSALASHGAMQANASVGSESTYDQRQEAEIEERLQRLGYLA